MLLDIQQDQTLVEDLSIDTQEILQLRTLEDAELIHVGGGNCVADY